MNDTDHDRDEYLFGVDSWLDSARIHLEEVHVAPPVVQELLAGARALAEETGERPQELFGTPRSWAQEQVAVRRDDGLPLAAPVPGARWRDVVVHGLYFAALFAASFLLIALLRRDSGRDFNMVAVLGFPVVVGIVVAAIRTAWSKTLARRPIGVAIALCGGIATTGILAIVLLFWVGHAHVTTTTGPWALGLLALGCVLATRILDTLVPRRPTRKHPEPRDDDEWLTVLAGVLRLRAEMSEGRIRTIAAEARAHAVETGSTLQEEFGRPEDYASTFAPDRVNRSRRMVWVYSALAVLAAIGAMPPDVDWWYVGFTLMWIAFAAHEWSLVRQATRPPGETDSA